MNECKCKYLYESNEMQSVPNYTQPKDTGDITWSPYSLVKQYECICCGRSFGYIGCSQILVERPRRKLKDTLGESGETRKEEVEKAMRDVRDAEIWKCINDLNSVSIFGRHEGTAFDQFSTWREFQFDRIKNLLKYLSAPEKKGVE